jgi:Protein of unknown function (DUF3175)
MAARSKRATHVRAKSATGSSRTRATAKRGSRSGPKASVKAKAPRKWSAGVMARSDAMDLESGVFKSHSARQVALSLKRSAESSHRRKSTPFRSAMSMLNFEINRGGKNLSAQQRKVLNAAKVELRKVFHREPARP